MSVNIGPYPAHDFKRDPEVGYSEGNGDRRYYLGVMTMVFPAGKYIILQCPDNNGLVERMWFKGDILLSLWDGFFTEGTIFYNPNKGALLMVVGEEGQPQFYKPMVPENLEGRAKRLYEYWSIHELTGSALVD